MERCLQLQMNIKETNGDSGPQNIHTRHLFALQTASVQQKPISQKLTISEMVSAFLNLNIVIRAGLQLRQALSYEKDEILTFYTFQKDKTVMHVSV
jgi:hypothetical protein